jgi:hypothetical protein
MAVAHVTGAPALLEQIPLLSELVTAKPVSRAVRSAPKIASGSAAKSSALPSITSRIPA